MRWRWALTILTLSKDGSTFLLNIEAEDSIAFIWISALSPKEYGRYIAELSISKNQAVDNEQVPTYITFISYVCIINLTLFKK